MKYILILIFLSTLTSTANSQDKCIVVYTESDRYRTESVLMRDAIGVCNKKLKDQNPNEIHPIIFIVPSIILGIVIGGSLRGYR